MDALGFIMDILFPAECVACGAHLPRGTLCRNCRAGIASHAALFCGSCAAPLHGCRMLCHPRAPFLMGAAGDYADPVLRTLVRALKFGRLRNAADPLADLLIYYCARLPVELRGFTVVPVPISRERMRERGFNQSALIAERFARFFGLPLSKDALVRTGHRTPQSEIADHAERRRNIRECFAVNAHGKNKKGASMFMHDHARVILIDDVTTSGATFTEAAHTLRAWGTRKILALAVAKAK